MTVTETGESRGILIIEDDEQLQSALSKVLSQQGYPITLARDGYEALECVERNPPWLVLTDLNLPGKGGMEFLREVRAQGYDMPVVVMTAYGSVDTAVEALKHGATEFLQKPFPLDRLEHLVQQLKSESASPLDPWSPIGHERPTLEPREGFLTRDPKVLQTLKMLELVANSAATILIQGESGTGKEVLARHIHRISPRAQQPFVAINCAALPDGLLESELFGYEKGAFTGALARRCGKFELAHQGTLLLDEIGEMSLGLQAKLLRVLQEREVDRLGSRHPVQVDVRVIATTNRNLAHEVQSGRFREDVFYRLSVMPFTLPPLRERVEDIQLLAEEFTSRSSRRNRRAGGGITDEAMQYLKSRPWRGNVRELENVIERAVLLAGNGPLQLEHVRTEERALLQPNVEQPMGTIWEMERDLIMRTLERHDGNRTHAARTLGISIRTLRNKLREYRQLNGGMPLGI
ncbi:MAG: sigma-54 dependent transcriptional regulator [Nitrospirales bacterium]|nr:sigma-54-dependent Fis family transcriptional regulator [Nitrospira sp.]MCB9711438.1 sigma-54-dependent Fis family transcriptional regulator [Nitrospiraceae bacterium]MDR4486246.1 sigma-54 dependent transcriptional regulator [Nitrospirales bacterium]